MSAIAIPFGNETFQARVWTEKEGFIGSVVAFDTETTLIEAPDKIPDFVIGSVFNGATTFYVRRQDLGVFWLLHQSCSVFMHNAAFDIAVITQACGFEFWRMIEAGQILDSSILYRLRSLAATGDLPEKYNLALVTKEIFGVCLEKKDAVRCDFGRFIKDGRVDYRSMPEEYLTYAARDAVATFKIGSALVSDCRLMTENTPLPQNGTVGTNGITAFGPLSHHVQLKGDLALRQIERNGVCIDAEAVEKLGAELDADIARQLKSLAGFGYVPGEPGNTAVYERILREIMTRRGIKIPVSEKNNRISQAENELVILLDEPFVQAFLAFRSAKKIKQTYLAKLQGVGRVHPRYALMVKTGRTSCSGFNVQNLPRQGHVRECVVATPGHVLIACDYGMLQLCTLAQIAFDRFGHSRMRDLINEGVDLHKFVAGQILGKKPEDVTKQERQKAKAVNFGLPGGMGVAGLREYAAGSYGVTLTEDEAHSWREAWLNLFPEMREYLNAGDDLYRLGDTLDLKSFPSVRGIDEQMGAMIAIRIAGGALETSKGRAFSKEEQDWAWEQIANGRASRFKRFADDILARRGSRELQNAIKPGHTAAIPTGRLRAECSYTESRNWPFQALESDGAKLALYDLMRAGFRIVAFVHDEVLVEVPEADDYRPVAEQISDIMITAMKTVCQDVTIRTEYAVMHRWTKDAKTVYDNDGRLRAYRVDDGEPASTNIVEMAKAA